MNKDKEYTKDSRLLLSNLKTAVRCYFMYSANAVAESDGIAYNELLFLRIICLYPIITSIAYLVLFSSMTSGEEEKETNTTVKLIHFATKVVSIVLHGLRITISTIILILEILLWLPRFILGTLLTPIGFLTSAGQIYALPCDVWDYLLNGMGVSFYKTVFVPCRFKDKDDSSPDSHSSTGNGKCIGIFSLMKIYEHTRDEDAIYNTIYYRLKQRTGRNPEIILLLAKKVIVSNWSPITLSTLVDFISSSLKKEQLPHCSWKILDLHSLFWTRMFLVFQDEYRAEFTSLESGTKRIDEIFPQLKKDIEEEGKDKVGPKFKALDNLGTVSKSCELENLLYSPLGWNKYHRMEAYENKVKVRRFDRRCSAHLLALAASIILLSFFFNRSRTSSDNASSSKSLESLSVDVYALVLAVYVFVSTFAGEAIFGMVEDIAEAKSERYGLIVNRAINSGFVRGFHVMDYNGKNGKWMVHKNEELKDASVIHQVSIHEAKLMNSVIQKTEGDANSQCVVLSDTNHFKRFSSLLSRLYDPSSEVNNA